MKSSTVAKWPIGIAIAIVAILAISVFNTKNAEEGLNRGFRLPDGDPVEGQLAFARLGCIQCHSIDGVDDAYENADNRPTHVILGGEVTRVKTYGNLVTSIINPSHSIKNPRDDNQVTETGGSKMPDLTGNLTVREMIDLVAYLHPQYKRISHEYAINDSYYGYNQIP